MPEGAPDDRVMVVLSVFVVDAVAVESAVYVMPLVTVLVMVVVDVLVGVVVDVTCAVPVTVELAVVVATMVEVAETGTASSLQAELRITELKEARADGVLNVEAACRFAIIGVGE